MSKFHALTVSQVGRETRDAVVVTFEVPPELRDAYRYTQGQHLTLRAAIDDEDVRRSYSICSSVQDDTLRVAIKRTPGGLFSTWASESLQAGASLDVMPPMGHFHVPLSSDNRKHYLAFAAGSGITPMLSIVKTTLQSEPKSSFTLFYGNRASSSVIFKEELAELKDLYLDRFKLVYVMSREQQDIDLFNGRIDKDKCAQFFKSWVALDDIDTAFICGPEQMMHEVSEALREHGFQKERIKVELFAASAPRREHVPRAHPIPGNADCEVTLVIDGNHVNFSMEKDKESVLDAALKHGIDVRHSCKAGVCSTCRCKVVEGKVDMDANYALEDYEVARGFALSCQSFPVTDRLVMDFDQDH
ncbi:MAG TPA: 1,2-phenylacetyl-CoA epoxidase subunit PaaE [Burkholderiaceae bacterium]|nr:1,2-phenylacetyl-CoA epoxidase subunit PaaE [Burkholderiaceae bacterium]